MQHLDQGIMEQTVQPSLHLQQPLSLTLTITVLPLANMDTCTHNHTHTYPHIKSVN